MAPEHKSFGFVYQAKPNIAWAVNEFITIPPSILAKIDEAGDMTTFLVLSPRGDTIENVTSTIVKAKEYQERKNDYDKGHKVHIVLYAPRHILDNLSRDNLRDYLMEAKRDIIL